MLKIRTLSRRPRWLLAGIGGGILLCIVLAMSRRSGVTFDDVTERAGIRFQHKNGATGRKLLPETMGSGVVAFDYDADGNTDLFFVNSTAWPGDPAISSPCALYRNRGEGTFDDVSRETGLAVELFGLGATAADYDNDGFPDLLITAIGGVRLFHNVPGPHGRTFVDVTTQAGLPIDSVLFKNAPAFWTDSRTIPFPSSAVWLDYDGDARLDLFVCQYVDWAPVRDLNVQAILPNGQRAYVPPTQFPGSHCQLFRNVDGTRFVDVSAEAGIPVQELRTPQGQPEPVGKALGVSVFDFDRDGWPDIVVANDTVRNFCFHNRPGPDGRRTFVEVGLPSGIAYSDGRPRGGMGIDTVELRPGQPVVLIANFTNEPNSLFRMLKSNEFRFSDSALADGLGAPSRGLMKFGALFLDYDLDGWPDLITCNGHLEPGIASARSGQTYAQPAQLFRFDGNQFHEMNASQVGDALFRPMVGRGIADLDFDHDGSIDLVLTENNGPARLFRNRNRKGNNWVRLQLQGDGTHSNRDAIGAEVEIEMGGMVRRFTVTGARGYLSQSELALTIGCGSSKMIDRVTVRWPGRDTQPETWSQIAVRQSITLIQGHAATRNSTTPSK